MQNLKYLYIDSPQTNVPKSFLDLYSNFVPYFYIKQFIIIPQQKENLNIQDIFNKISSNPQLGFDPTKDLNEYTPEQKSKIEEAIKQEMFTFNKQSIDILNVKMLFLVNFYKDKVPSKISSGYDLNITDFFNKCKENKIGIDILQKKDNNNTSYRIILNDSYKYFYANYVYLTIGNIAEYISLSGENLAEFSHIIMKYHLLSDAEGRKLTENNKPKFPDLSSAFSSYLPDPSDISLWEYDKETSLQISKDNPDLTLLLANYNTRNGNLIGYNSNEPILKIESTTYTKYTTPSFFYEISLYPAMNYIHTKYNIGFHLYTDYETNENFLYKSISYYNNYVRIYFDSESNMGSFKRFVIYI